MFRNSEFVFWEEGYGAQQFPLPTRNIETMIHDQQWTIFTLLLPLWQPDAIVNGVLRLENGDEYLLSGFPRPFNCGMGHHSKCDDWKDATHQQLASVVRHIC